MISVQNLSKLYGTFPALRGVSFEVPTGQVLGFLGPNGAGKSTTMKILTGYLYASGGSANVDGIDVEKNPVEVRRRVGYLPETNPLYADMRVDDYLRFVGEIRGVKGRDLRAAMDRVIASCGLQKVVKKGISELSKGYRQRVGLAQAMIHDPQILILDEPTSGLDPNQIVEIRDLIRSLGANRTVVLSTHYLQEVEATCDRILIVSGGQLVADGTHRQLCDMLPTRKVVVEIAGSADDVATKLQSAFPGARVEKLVTDPAIASFRVEQDAGAAGDMRGTVADLASKNSWKVLGMRQEGSLEDVFRHLTYDKGAAAAQGAA
ncbi:MAG: ATP-binding cassette domain-containing protein [Planctomycetes bacterium]|nr:ATP-binding cassette domain-containing protein [Planctomycetota bacterium]